jgi:hypothetical protein
MKQADAMGLLQRPDLQGDGRLGQPEPARSGGEAALAGDRVERAKLGMIHK